MSYLTVYNNLNGNEGFEERPYKDNLGFWTIGFGFKMADLWIPKDIAELLLMRYVMKYWQEAFKQYPWLVEMPPIIQDTVVEMCYQMGVYIPGPGGFDDFDGTIAHLKSREWEDAAQHIEKSLMAQQTPNRAKWYASQIRKAKNDT